MVSTHVFSARGPRFESGHFWFYFFVYFCPKFLLRQEFRQRFLDSLWSKLMASMVKSRLQKLLCEMAFKSLCTPEPRPLKMGTFDSNAAINSEGSGDMSSTQYNQIWSSANSFFRNRQKFACFLEHWPEILIAVNWQWSLGKNSSLSKNWDYW